MGECAALVPEPFCFEEAHTVAKPLIDEGLVIDESNMRVYLEGNEIRLSRLQYHVLQCLGQRAGQLVSRDALVQQVWGETQWWIDSSLDSLIYRLRKKLGDTATNPTYLETRREFGYILHHARIIRHSEDSTTRNQPPKDTSSKKPSIPHSESPTSVSGELPPNPRPWNSLTPRQKEIFMLLGDEQTAGLTNKALARHLNIKESTLKKHLQRIYRKLGVDNRFSAVLLAVRAKEAQQ